MASAEFRIGAVVLGMVLCGAASAEPMLLDGDAFEAPTACQVEPFANPSLGEREHSLDRACGRNRLDLRVDTPRAQQTDTGPSRLVLEVDQVMTRQVLDAFAATARLGWSGATQEGFSRMVTGRALLAAGARLRLHEQWAVDMNLGRDIGPGLRSRATMAGMWRPADEHMVFAELAAEPGGVANAVGYRWWLVPDRAVVDVTARRSAGGDTVEPRLGLQVFGFAR
jgi:hypothetical protein